jgi:flagellar hook-associated protein 3 FlgL
MRISTAQIFQQSVEAMLERQKALSETEQQVATGKRILKPSDDPSGAVRILDLKEAEQRLAQYQRNADWATARLDQEETALIGMQNLVQRVRELAVRGNNGTMNAEDRAAIAAEVTQLRDSFLQLANTRDANGEYVFAGFDSQSAPMTMTINGLGQAEFSFTGDDGQRMLQIGESREVAIGDPGSLFMNLSSADTAATNGERDIGEIIDRVAFNFNADTPDQYSLTDLDTALSRLSEMRAKIGARMNAIDDQKVSNDAFTIAVTDVRSSLEDLDFAEAISRFNQQLTALQASQQAFIKVQDLSLFNFIR